MPCAAEPFVHFPSLSSCSSCLLRKKCIQRIFVCSCRTSPVFQCTSFSRSCSRSNWTNSHHLCLGFSSLFLSYYVYLRQCLYLILVLFFGLIISCTRNTFSRHKENTFSRTQNTFPENTVPAPEEQVKHLFLRNTSKTPAFRGTRDKTHLSEQR
jgi:hypothetical protein